MDSEWPQEVRDAGAHPPPQPLLQDGNQDPYDNWVSSLHASSESPPNHSENFQSQPMDTSLVSEAVSATRTDGISGEIHTIPQLDLSPETPQDQASSEVQHLQHDETPDNSSHPAVAILDDSHTMIPQEMEDSSLKSSTETTHPNLPNQQHIMSPAHYEFPRSATHGEFEPAAEEEADTAAAIADLDDWAKHAQTDGPPQADSSIQAPSQDQSAHGSGHNEGSHLNISQSASEDPYNGDGGAFEPLAVASEGIGQSQENAQMTQSLDTQLPEEGEPLLEHAVNESEPETHVESNPFSTEEDFDQLLSEQPNQQPQIESNFNPIPIEEAHISSSHEQQDDAESNIPGSLNAQTFGDGDFSQLIAQSQEEENPFGSDNQIQADSSWLEPSANYSSNTQSALIPSQEVAEMSSDFLARGNESLSHQPPKEDTPFGTSNQTGNGSEWDQIMEDTNDEDAWAQALGSEPKLEDAFASAFDDDGFLEDESAPVEATPTARKSEVIQGRYIHQASPTTVSNPYEPARNRTESSSSSQPRTAPQYGANTAFAPPPPVKNAGPAKPMQFFEDLPSVEPPKRKPKQAPPPPPPPQESRGPPGPTQSLASQSNLSHPPQTSDPPMSQFRPPGRLDPFPPQPSVPPLSSFSDSLQKPPQQASRYSPAPQSRGLSPSKYSTGPSKPTPPPNQRYSPAPAAMPQGVAGANGSPASRQSMPSPAAPSQGPPSFQGDVEPPLSNSSRKYSATSNRPLPPRQDSRYSPAMPPKPIAAGLPAPQQNESSFFAELPAEPHAPHQHPPPHSAAAAMTRFSPRTSSPLASSDQRPNLDRSTTQPLPRQNSVPETELEAPAFSNFQRPGTASSMPPQHAVSSSQAQQSTRPSAPPYTPPPHAIPPLSARKQFASPPRPRTQSPEASRKALNPVAKSIERPRSAEHHQTPQILPTQFVNSQSVPKQPSATDGLDFIPPSDSMLASDPLERWKGYPVFRWSPSGFAASSFPMQTPRYGGGQSAPAIKCTPGTIKIQKLKDIVPTDESLSSFPGPLKSKSKKKEVIAWLSSRIEVLQQEIGLAQSAAMDPRPSERLLLWQILRLLVEHDGNLAGNANAESSVKQLLSPHAETLARRASVSAADAPSIDIKADAVNVQAVSEIRTELTKGDREKAVWKAVDNRLWGHAMLIASTMNTSIWKQVSQEFVKKEVRSQGTDTQSLAALYSVFAGNVDESIDELVPVSARAGFQMMNAQGPAQSRNTLDGLNKWRETLSLILTNRSTGDEKALITLGKLLKGYGRIEAAHVCFLFARSVVHLGGVDDAEADFSLIGANMSGSYSNSTPEIETILLSEVYEFTSSLSPSNVSQYIPHLQVYKIYHAQLLAEQGQREKALQYCDAIAAALKATTKSSPYFHPTLVWQLDDLTKRLSQAPKDSSSWISKPSIGKVGGGLWGKLEGFIAGEETDAASTGSNAASDHDVGRFAPYGGGTPQTISRSQSIADFHAGDPNRTVPSSTLRYGPQSFQQPGSDAYGPYQYPQDAGDARHGPVPTSNSIYSSSPATSNPYMPNATSSYSPAPSTMSLNHSQPTGPYQPQAPLEQPSSFPSYDPPVPEQLSGPASNQTSIDHTSKLNGYTPAVNGYAPESTNDTSTGQGYQPPTSSYEPPTSTYQPYEPTSPEAGPDSPEKPRRKQIFDEDDDDFAKKAEDMKKKERAQRDRENDELFKKAAEADAAAAKEKAAAAKKGGWLPSFGLFGGKKDPNAPVVHKVKLGEQSKFEYDETQKRWINKAAGAVQTEAAAPPPPPPKAMGGPPSRGVSAMGGPPPGPAAPASNPMLSTPPIGPVSRSSTPASNAGGPPGASGPPAATGVGSLPPSRPPTSMSTTSSKPAENLDDLLDGGGSTSRAGKGGTLGRKKKGGARYVDTMAK